MYNKKKIIGSIAIAVVVIIFSIGAFLNSKKQNYNYDDIFVEDQQEGNTVSNSNNINKTTSKNTSGDTYSNSTTETVSSIKVEIKGEIKHPGVYTMEQDSRLQDLIYKAGGLKKDADTDNMQSLAQKLKDEECIIIYNKKDSKNKKIASVSNNSIESSSQTGNEQQVININTANLEELQKINGVGPVTAQNIIDYREKNGGFKSIEDLKNVDRIGDKTFEKMKDSITVQWKKCKKHCKTIIKLKTKLKKIFFITKFNIYKMK